MYKRQNSFSPVKREKGKTGVVFRLTLVNYLPVFIHYRVSIMHKGGNDMEELGVKNDLLAKAIPLKDLASFQDHSIVSREIVKKASGTVTVFAFDRGEGLSEHTAPFDALVYILEGKARVSIEGNPHDVQEGEMIIMPADRPHALKAVSRFKMLLVMVK
jgi:quercetin dioxygenase-like cupin family protein